MILHNGFILLEQLDRLNLNFCFTPKVSGNRTHQEVNTEPYAPFEAQQVSQNSVRLLKGWISINLTK